MHSENRLNPKLFEKIMKSPTVADRKEGAIRTAITRIRIKNKGLTLNAAASIFAEKNKINVSRYLEPEDRRSLREITVSGTIVLPQPTTKKATNFKKPLQKYGKKFWPEAYQNAQSYMYVYVLENSLRQLILEKFQDEKDWWENKNFVSEKIQEYSIKIQEAEKEHKWLGKRGDHPIYYVNLEHLLKIIEKNFNPRFKGIFNLQNLSVWITECSPIRNLIAHNIKTELEERQNIEIKTKYICNLIEQTCN